MHYALYYYCFFVVHISAIPLHKERAGLGKSAPFLPTHNPLPKIHRIPRPPHPLDPLDPLYSPMSLFHCPSSILYVEKNTILQPLI